ncbi:MAG: divergent PAP2 family protein [Clostridiales bacterium]|nr:divergent PAP2 family protein [Clostridiales bacterium]
MFFENHVLVAALLAWLIAQLLKGILYLIQNRKMNWDRFWGSGGMPSSHAALVTSLVMSIVIEDGGISSTSFAIALVFAFVVIYDATGVRYATGEQGKVLNKINELKGDENKLFEKDFKELIGHTKLEVFAGSVLGIAVAIVYWLIFVR